MTPFWQGLVSRLKNQAKTFWLLIWCSCCNTMKTTARNQAEFKDGFPKVGSMGGLEPPLWKRHGAKSFSEPIPTEIITGGHWPWGGETWVTDVTEARQRSPQRPEKNRSPLWASLNIPRPHNPGTAGTWTFPLLWQNSKTTVTPKHLQHLCLEFYQSRISLGSITQFTNSHTLRRFREKTVGWRKYTHIYLPS